jgi:hypothetical protein
MSPATKELVRESRWMRVYNIGDRHMLYESKFLIDHLQVAPTSVKNDWKGMTEEERLEFALAFSAKPDLVTGDEEVLNHLMEFGSAKVLSSIALLAVRHPDKEKTLRFLIHQVEKGQKPLVNFYQALGLLDDRRAVPTLRKAYDMYKASQASGDCKDSDLVDYLQCCKALLVMEGNSEYELAISEMHSHSSEQISRIAKRLLESKT